MGEGERGEGKEKGGEGVRRGEMNLRGKGNEGEVKGKGEVRACEGSERTKEARGETGGERRRIRS